MSTPPLVGQRVRLVSWAPSVVSGLENGEPSVPPGTEGIVKFVDGVGTAFVDWDNGAMLGVCQRGDRVEIVPTSTASTGKDHYAA